MNKNQGSASKRQLMSPPRADLGYSDTDSHQVKLNNQNVGTMIVGNQGKGTAS